MPAASDIRRKRLLFRSWHRGTRECDLIMGRFADTYLAGFDTRQLDRYEALLECSDADLFDWVAGRAAPPEVVNHDVMRLLLTFRLTSTLQKNPSPPSGGRGKGEGGTLSRKPLELPPHPGPLPQGGEGERSGRAEAAPSGSEKARPV